ncbi:MAG TPA: hypothetical protein VFQ53_08910 [Kofleriaceae bacterium]|nr:hypothetical protein [Kofleriaceae bacterium]
MKRTLLVATLAVLPLFAACKKKDDNAGTAGQKTADKAADPTKPAQPDKPIELTDTADLGAAITDPDVTGYKGLKAKVPAGTKLEAGMTGVVVRIGESQAYELSKAFEPGQFVAKNKGEAQSDSLDKLVKFHVDTPEAILWESKSELGGDNNFHFAAEVKVGNDSFKCFNKGYGHFTKAQAEALLKSCQSLTK